MDFDQSVMKSFAVATRTVGLVAHMVEEIEMYGKESIGQKLIDYFAGNTKYTAGIAIKS
ncbi:hypothetical protein [Sporosarcina sp. P13]|uniref:hypothetical protein n=1 Tax=Sporosarcina sp. P13 TaxID=2048263 RepID=UPI0013042AD2|nr:hypothetical protein [Sporosarcina sp. P13]